MAPAATTLPAPAGEILAHSVEEPRKGWIGWATTTDHKKIGILYLVTSFAFFILGGVEALLMRLQLGAADNTFVTPEIYNQLFTVHGTTMIFLFVVPMLAGFGNYFVPLMIGARDVAFPRLNALSYWLFLFGGLVFYASFLFHPIETGWTVYAPLSDDTFQPNGGVDAWIFLIHLTGISSLVGSINFYVTIANMRAPGMSWSRLPLFCWSILIYSALLILTIPEIAAAVTMLLTDRHFGTAFFDPSGGGSPMLWQHLFWFLGHPEVYVLILPSFGMISEILPVFARKPIFGYKAIAAATVVIALLGLLVWGHHLFTSPSETSLMIAFMVSTMLIAVPTGIKIFNWIGTLWGGSLNFRPPLYFALGFLSLFVTGGITGVVLSLFPVDWQLHDTYFVVAHFHYTMVGGSIFAIFAGLYYWLPKITGKMLSEGLAKLSFWLMFIGFNVTFLIQHSLGMEGMPRRIYEYPASAGWEGYNLISTIGSFTLGLGIAITIANVLISLKKGPKAGPDPWKGNTLEWFTTSPPQENNFDEIPTVRSLEPMKDIRKALAEKSTASQPQSEKSLAPS